MRFRFNGKTYRWTKAEGFLTVLAMVGLVGILTLEAYLVYPH